MAEEIIAVCGGGPAALTTALGLLQLKKECRIEIWEASSQTDYYDESTGAAVLVTPTALQALQSLGCPELMQNIFDQASAICRHVRILPSADVLYDRETEMEVKPHPSSFPTLMIRWGVLRRLLVESLMSPSHCGRCRLRFGRRVVAYRRSSTPGETFRLEYFSSDPKGSVISVSEPYSFIIAADGKRSIFRPTPLVPSNPVLNFKAAVRYTPSLRLKWTADTAYAFLDGPFPCFLGPAGGNDWIYWSVSVPLATTGRLGSCMSKWKQYILHQLRSGPPECLLFVDAINATPHASIYCQESAQAAIPDNLTPSPGIVLVGDAAHAINNSYGQATSYAIESAVILSECLAHGTKEGYPMECLKVYSKRRVGPCVDMQKKSKNRLAMVLKSQATSTEFEENTRNRLNAMSSSGRSLSEREELIVAERRKSCSDLLIKRTGQLWNQV